MRIVSDSQCTYSEQYLDTKARNTGIGLDHTVCRYDSLMKPAEVRKPFFGSVSETSGTQLYDLASNSSFLTAY